MSVLDVLNNITDKLNEVADNICNNKSEQYNNELDNTIAGLGEINSTEVLDERDRQCKTLVISTHVKNELPFISIENADCISEQELHDYILNYLKTILNFTITDKSNIIEVVDNDGTIFNIATALNQDCIDSIDKNNVNTIIVPKHVNIKIRSSLLKFYGIDILDKQDLNDINEAILSGSKGIPYISANINTLKYKIAQYMNDVQRLSRG